MEHNIWVTSDLHFCHDKEFLYKPRGFDSVWDMNNTIVTNWNNFVGPFDDVYVLGDIMLNDNFNGIKLLKSLKGNIHIILGNHDTDTRVQLYNECFNVVEITYATIIKQGKYRFYLSHYPAKVGNYDDEETHKKFYSLCGHTHTQDKWLDFNTCKAYHCELDAHYNAPISLEYIIDDIKRHGVYEEF